MRRRWIWLGGGAAATLTVALGVATNQVLNNSVWSWRWFAAAVALAATAIAFGHIMDAVERPRATPRPDLADAKGHPLPISHVSPLQLGVHPSQFGPEGDTPYIERDVDDILASALRDGDRRAIYRARSEAGRFDQYSRAGCTNLPG